MAPRDLRQAFTRFALLALAVVTAVPGGAAAAPPAIAFESEICDLGSIVQGERPDCLFSFANLGGEDLRIAQVEPSCGCTTILLSAPLLHPGERGRIRVVFDSDAYAGEVVKEIEVRSNDPDRRSVTLRVKSLIEPEIDFEPREVAFYEVVSGTALKQVVMLTNRRAAPVRVIRLEAQPSSYRCLLPSWGDRSQPLVIESWDRIAIDVMFTPPGTLAMPIAGECALEVEGPRKRVFSLKLLALPAR